MTLTPAASPTDSDPIDLSVLDALRGLLALYVVLFHAWGLLWAGGLSPESTELPTSGLAHVLALTAGNLRFGHQAVLIFFLISGFCIHLRQATARVAGGGDVKPHFQVRSFAARRMRRLLPPLLAALLLTSVLDSVGTALNPALYDHTLTRSPISDWLTRAVSYEPLTVAGNLLLQGGLSVPVLGSNGPVWSLSFEVWFYAAYPVVFALPARLTSRKMLIVAGLVSIASAFVYVVEPFWLLRVSSHWFIWVAGAAVAVAYAIGRPPVWLRRAGPASLVGTALLSAIYWPVGDPIFDFVWCVPLAGSFAFLMLGLPGGARRVVERQCRRLLPLGRISYSLYLTHFPLFVLIAAWWLRDHLTLPTGAELAALGAGVALVVGAAVWAVAERPFTPPVPARHVPLPRGVLNKNPWVDSSSALAPVGR